MVNVSQEDYEAKKASLQSLQLVAENSFEELNPASSVANEGAMPCLIVWQYNSESEKMERSGHFRIVSKKESLERDIESLQWEPYFREEDPQEILVQEDTKNSIYTYDHGGYNKFVEMGRRITEETGRKNNDSTYIYLSGQNLPITRSKVERDQAMVDNVIRQSDVRDIIKSWGVPDENIVDLRKPSNDGEDDTLWIPDENKLYHVQKPNGLT